MARDTYTVVFKEAGETKTDEVKAATPSGVSRAFNAKMRKEKRKTGIVRYYPKP
jgi:hypothetical protein